MKKAFTLTEMLVTISVTSLVMAVMMPALSRTRTQGRTLMCLNNLRQLGLAAQVYANDNDDFYPIAYVTDKNPDDLVSEYFYWDFNHIGDKVEPGLLWLGQTDIKIQQCPAFKGSSNADDPYTGYNYNTSFIGHGSNEIVPTPAKTEQVKKPHDCALFGDGEYSDGANKFMRSPCRSSVDGTNFRTAGTQGYRHGEKTNVLWCDGHATSQKELYTNTDKNSDKLKLEKFNKTAKVKIGFLSPDNSAYDLE